MGTVGVRPIAGESADSREPSGPVSSAHGLLEARQNGDVSWLENRRLEGACLRGINLMSADLSGATFDDADLTGADLTGANLLNARFERATLVAAKFRDTRDLAPAALAGSNLAGCTLPSHISYESLAKSCDERVSACRAAWFTLLATCAYCLLTLWSTTDADLILPSLKTSTLPIIGMSVPMVSFYYCAPWLILLVALFLQQLLLGLAEAVRRLPAVMPDGRRFDETLHPWLVLGVLRAQMRALRQHKTPGSRLQVVISILLVWVAPPAVVLALMCRSLVTGDSLLLASQSAALLIVGLGVAWGYSEFQVDRARTPRRAAELVRPALRFGIGGLVFLGSMLIKYWEHPAVVAIGADLQGQPLRGVRLTAARLDNARLQRADLTYADLVGAYIRDGNLIGAQLEYAALQGANFAGSDLRKAKLRGAELDGAFMEKVRFFRSDLTRADLAGAVLREAFLPRTTLLGANLTGADLTLVCAEYAHFDDAELKAADLSGGHFYFAQMRRANLTGGAKLAGADLRFADLSDARLVDADLSDADLTDAVLMGADLTGANLDGANLSRAILTRALGVSSSQLDGACGSTIRAEDGQLVALPKQCPEYYPAPERPACPGSGEPEGL